MEASAHSSRRCLAGFLCAGASLLQLALLAGCQEERAPAARPNQAGGPSASQTAGSIPYVAGLEAGLAQARAAGKPALAIFVIDPSRHCRQLTEETLTDARVVALADRFVCVLIDGVQESTACRRLGVEAFPAIQFFSARGQPLNRVSGSRPADEVLFGMHAALQTVARHAREEAAAPR